MTGLSSKELHILQEVFKNFTNIEEVLLFGSRALNTHKKASDIDIAIKGKLDIQTLSKLKYRLEEDTTLPYFFDVIIYERIDNKELKEHIDKFGKTIYIFKP